MQFDGRTYSAYLRSHARQVLLRKLPRFYWLYMDQSAEKETESEESEQVSMVEAVVDRDVSEELQQPGSNNSLVRQLVCMGLHLHLK